MCNSCPNLKHHLPQFVIMKLPQFVTTFTLICNITKLPQFVTQACPNLQYTYIFVIEFCCSFYNLWDLGWMYVTHQVTWLIDHVITWFFKKTLISTFARIIAINFIKVWLKLSWKKPSRNLTHLSCGHFIFSKRCISSFTRPMTTKLGRVMS